MKFVTDIRASTILYNFIRSNDKIKQKWIIPTNVCHYVPAAILKTGASIEILDIEEQTLCLNKDMVLEKLKKHTYSGVVYVRNYGFESSTELFFKSIKEINQNILIVDDKCLARPCIEKTISSNVDMELYSTGYSKFVDLGYGGYAKIKNACSYLSEKNLDFNKIDENYFFSFFKEEKYANIGSDIYRVINSNWLEEGKVPLEDYFFEIKKQFETICRHKAKINDIYSNLIPDELQISKNHNDWRFNIYVKNRNEILNKIMQKNLFASKHYFSLSEIFKTKKTPVWNQLQSKILNLFNDFRYSEKQAEQTALLILKMMSK